MRVARRAVFAGSLLLLLVVPGSLRPRLAMAGLVGCRSDPVVLLSNGSALDLSADIGDAQSDVQRVDYAVHVPAGIRIVAVLNTDGLIGLAETFHFSSDNPTRQFNT